MDNKINNGVQKIFEDMGILYIPQRIKNANNEIEKLIRPTNTPTNGNKILGKYTFVRMAELPNSELTPDVTQKLK